MAEDDVQIGYPEEWQRFVEAHARFVDSLPRVFEAINIAFNRRFTPTSTADKVVFYLGFLAVEDFDEIFLLAGNGRGFGCQKILRGMFERIVTEKYLHENPVEADRFLDFYHVSRYKLSQSLHAGLGEEFITKEVLDEHKKRRDEVRDKFRVKCSFEDCANLRDGISWTDLDLVAMTRRVGLQEVMSIGYYLPMSDTHASMVAVMNRIATNGEALTMFGSVDKARAIAGPALMMAHYLTLVSLELQRARFSDIADQLGKLLSLLDEDFKSIWGHPAPEVT
jgi:hypothetical protein